MNDPQMKVFAGRLRRIDKIHRRGGGFEAEGTLGQSFYTRAAKRKSRRPFMRPALVAVGALILFKASVLASLGATDYQARLDVLRQGSTVDKAGAFVMTVDPVSEIMAGVLKPLFK